MKRPGTAWRHHPSACTAACDGQEISDWCLTLSQATPCLKAAHTGDSPVSTLIFSSTVPSVTRGKHSDCKMLVLRLVFAFAPLVQSVSSKVREAQYAKSLSAANLVYSDYLLFDCRARSKLSCSGLCAVAECCVRFAFTGKRGTPGRCRGHSSRLLPSGLGTNTPGANTYVMPGVGVPINAALNKVSSQSSNKYPDSGHASVANDGILNASRTEGDYATHTDMVPGKASWWQVDLGSCVPGYSIISVIITGRSDCCGDRLHDFDIHVYNENPATNSSAPGSLCFHFTGPMEDAMTKELTCLNGPISGRFVRVTNSPNEFLSLGEVQVMALPVV